MQKQLTTLSEIKLIGLSLRTNNANEMTPAGKIGPLVGKYFGTQLANKIPGRKKPGITYSVFTEYDSDEHGDYTYFIGEAVNDFNHVPEGFKTLSIVAGKYQKFTTNQGPMPMVIIEAWQKIWAMKADELGGKRNYRTDFELYDERAQDRARTIADLYIGIA